MRPMSHLQAQQRRVALSRLPGMRIRIRSHSRSRSRSISGTRRFQILPRRLHLQLADIDKSVCGSNYDRSFITAWNQTHSLYIINM